MRLTAHCRGLVDAAFKEERKRIAARRDDELKRAEENYRKAFAAAEAQRDEKLRKINEVYAKRMVEVQTTQQRDMREAIDAARSPSGRAARPGRDQSAQARREVQGAQGAVGDELRNGLARDGRPLARRDEGRGRRARCDQPRGRRLLPGLERRRLGRTRRCRGSFPRWFASGRSRSSSPPCRAGSRPTPA